MPGMNSSPGTPTNTNTNTFSQGWASRPSMNPLGSGLPNKPNPAAAIKPPSPTGANVSGIQQAAANAQQQQVPAGGQGGASMGPMGQPMQPPAQPQGMNPAIMPQQGNAPSPMAPGARNQMQQGMQGMGMGTKMGTVSEARTARFYDPLTWPKLPAESASLRGEATGTKLASLLLRGRGQNIPYEVSTARAVVSSPHSPTAAALRSAGFMKYSAAIPQQQPGMMPPPSAGPTDPMTATLPGVMPGASQPGVPAQPMPGGDPSQGGMPQGGMPPGGGAPPPGQPPQDPAAMIPGAGNEGTPPGPGMPPPGQPVPGTSPVQQPPPPMQHVRQQMDGGMQNLLDSGEQQNAGLEATGDLSDQAMAMGEAGADIKTGFDLRALGLMVKTAGCRCRGGCKKCSTTKSAADQNRMKGWQWRSLQNQEDQGDDRWTPRLFPTESTPLTEMLASPGKQAILKALAGGALGAGAGYFAGQHLGEGGNGAAGAAIGGGVGALAGGAHGYGKRLQENDRINDALRQLPPGAVVRDYKNLSSLQKQGGSVDQVIRNVMQTQLGRGMANSQAIAKAREVAKHMAEINAGKAIPGITTLMARPSSPMSARSVQARPRMRMAAPAPSQSTLQAESVLPVPQPGTRGSMSVPPPTPPAPRPSFRPASGPGPSNAPTVEHRPQELQDLLRPGTGSHAIFASLMKGGLDKRAADPLVSPLGRDYNAPQAGGMNPFRDPRLVPPRPPRRLQPVPMGRPPMPMPQQPPPIMNHPLPQTPEPPLSPEMEVAGSDLRSRVLYLKSAAQDSSAPQRSSTGESTGLSYAHKPDHYAQGPDAWKSVTQYFKGGKYVKEEPNLQKGRHKSAAANPGLLRRAVSGVASLFQRPSAVGNQARERTTNFLRQGLRPHQLMLQEQAILDTAAHRGRLASQNQLRRQVGVGSGVAAAGLGASTLLSNSGSPASAGQTPADNPAMSPAPPTPALAGMPKEGSLRAIVTRMKMAAEGGGGGKSSGGGGKSSGGGSHGASGMRSAPAAQGPAQTPQTAKPAGPAPQPSVATKAPKPAAPAPQAPVPQKATPQAAQAAQQGQQQPAPQPQQAAPQPQGAPQAAPQQPQQPGMSQPAPQGGMTPGKPQQGMQQQLPAPPAPHTPMGMQQPMMPQMQPAVAVPVAVPSRQPSAREMVDYGQPQVQKGLRKGVEATQNQAQGAVPGNMQRQQQVTGMSNPMMPKPQQTSPMMGQPQPQQKPAPAPQQPQQQQPASAPQQKAAALVTQKQIEAFAKNRFKAAKKAIERADAMKTASAKASFGNAFAEFCKEGEELFLSAR